MIVTLKKHPTFTFNQVVVGSSPTGLTNSIFVPDNFSNFGSKVANLALRFATFGAIHLS